MLEVRDFIAIALAFSDEELRRGRLSHVAGKLRDPSYRIPAAMLAAAITLEMLA